MQGQTVYLIDTPSFNDANRPDAAILKEIVFLLCQIYRHGIRLGGIVFLHRISDKRVSSSAKRNLDLLKRMCGRQAAPRVIIVSTMWDLVDSAKMDASEALARESEMKAKDDLWGSLCQQGSHVKRSSGDTRSALAILTDLITLCEHSGFATMRLQEELVDQGKKLHETLAGQEVSERLARDERRHMEELGSDKLDEPQGSSDHGKAVLELKRKLQAAKQGQEELRVSLQDLVTEKEGTYAKALSKVRSQLETIATELSEHDRGREQLEKARANLLSTLEKQKEGWQRDHAALHQDVRRGRQRALTLDSYRQRMDVESQRIAKNLEGNRKADELERARIDEKDRFLRKREVAKRNLLPLFAFFAGVGDLA